MGASLISEECAAGAILGGVFPALDLAAEELYVRVNAGERIDGKRIPASLGFETGSLDSVLLEAFKACVPAVKTFLTAGGLILISDWRRRRASAEEEQRRMRELATMQQTLSDVRESMHHLVTMVVKQGHGIDLGSAEQIVIRIIVQAPEVFRDDD